MSISLLPYENKYRDETIKCLKRNFEWMASKTDDYVGEWLDRITEYSWKNMHSDLRSFKYPKGMVITSNGDVVGFLGCTFSSREKSGNMYTYLVPTGWAIDEKYRLTLVKAMRELFKNVDIIADFTPRKSVQELFEKIFRFERIENKDYRVYWGIPYKGKKSVVLKIIDDITCIDNLEVRKEYEDNCQYDGVSLCEITDGEEKAYIFYHCNPGLITRILKITNRKFVTSKFHEIIYGLFLIERNRMLFNPRRIKEYMYSIARSIKWHGGFAVCPSRFLDVRVEHPGLFVTECAHYVKYNSSVEKYDIDLLYSELVLLHDK